MKEVQLLQKIYDEQKQLATDQLNFAGKVSTFMNEQELFNQRISDLLESNPKTNQKGLVETVRDNETRISSIETTQKITAGKIAIGITILSGIGAFVLKIIGFFDK